MGALFYETKTECHFDTLLNNYTIYYTIPCDVIASATLRKPAILAPATRS